MSSNLLHTPEGVRDIYNAECERKIRLQQIGRASCRERV